MKLLPWIALALAIVAGVVGYLIWRDRHPQVNTVGIGEPTFTPL